MYAKTFITFLLPVLAVYGMPAKRDAAASLEASLFLEIADVFISVQPTPTQFTAFITSVTGVPLVEISSIGGPAITLATTTGVPTVFAGATFTVVPGPNDKKNGAVGLMVSRPLLTGMVSALGAVAAGAMLVL
ncbi:hypothetical protein C2E23DRAFT_284909 [Lenzites betulinus]|nr:hypothetical protein C2E23DRAFT_284909 [Lenzites betulinus]